MLYIFCFNVLCRVPFHVKKQGFGGGGKKAVTFQKGGQSEFATHRTAGGKLVVTVADGLPNNTSTVFLH